MTYLPFPEPHASESNARTAATYEASRRAPRQRIGETRTEPRVAGYRLPCGALRRCYDPYRPDYPEGAEPGWVDAANTLQFFPNETTGYRSTFSNFRPLEGVCQ